MFGFFIKNFFFELGFILFLFGFGVIIFVIVVYYVERGVEGIMFVSIFDSMWYVIVIMIMIG